MKSGLPPVLDEHTEVLILGSMPSDQSLAKSEYYGNPSNDFWRIMADVLGCPELPNLPYKSKREVLLSRGIGLWDAYRCCERQGSMDGNISQQQANDFTLLRTEAPRLRLVCFNGGEAVSAEQQVRALGYATTALLSSSSANRKDMNLRLEQWRSALAPQPPPLVPPREPCH